MILHEEHDDEIADQPSPLYTELEEQSEVFDQNSFSDKCGNVFCSAKYALRKLLCEAILKFDETDMQLLMPSA